MTFNCQTGTNYFRLHYFAICNFPLTVCHACTYDHEMLSTTLFISLTSNLFQLEIRLSCIKFSVCSSHEHTESKRASVCVWQNFTGRNSKGNVTSYFLIERSFIVLVKHFNMLGWSSSTELDYICFYNSTNTLVVKIDISRK